MENFDHVLLPVDGPIAQGPSASQFLPADEHCRRRAVAGRFGISRRLLLLFFGFAGTCPLLVMESPNLRLTEILAVLALVCAMWRIATSGNVHPVVRLYGPLLLLTLSWVVAEVYFGSFTPTEFAGRMLVVRWIEAFPIAYCLVVFSAEETGRRILALGMLAGVIADLILLFLDDQVFSVTHKPLFDTTTLITFAAGEYRAAGIFGHPNGAAIGTLLLVPLVIGLIRERRIPRLFIFALIPATIEVFLLTKTRGASSAAILLVLLSIFRIFRPRTILLMCAATFIFGLSIITLQSASLLDDDATKVITERFDRPAEMDENLTGRLDTMVTAIQLIAEHPLGMGSSYMYQMEAKVDFEATHNAFLQLALLGGIPLALAVTVPLLVAAAGCFKRESRLESWLAAYLCMAFCFETAFFLPMIPALTLWAAWPVRASPKLAQ